ncbi:hypothetical protein [Flavobacterium sp. UBA6135]|uniref:hypothetical protein n=1 Tax=Flavobacterium sp. UBA6135 TaxID=1946553 RepID=UPI0025BF0152|nr:hypothetical protein [Flavobacterium sp. UBA6135]
MNKQSLFFTFLVAIVSIVIMFQLIQFLAKRKNIKSENQEKLSLTYTIWFCSLLISFSLYLKIALQQIENAIEYIIYSDEVQNAFLAVMEKIAVFTGFTFVATFLVYYIVNFTTKITFTNRIESHEIENENYGYFLLKGIAMITFVLITLPVFEHFLMWFLPRIETPFYK